MYTSVRILSLPDPYRLLQVILIKMRRLSRDVILSKYLWTEDSILGHREMVSTAFRQIQNVQTTSGFSLQKHYCCLAEQANKSPPWNPLLILLPRYNWYGLLKEAKYVFFPFLRIQLYCRCWISVCLKCLKCADQGPENYIYLQGIQLHSESLSLLFTKPFY